MNSAGVCAIIAEREFREFTDAQLFERIIAPMLAVLRMEAGKADADVELRMSVQSHEPETPWQPAPLVLS